ncbi:Protein-tyrosine-phosphatase [[Candida] zeylanoides]
MSSSPTICVSPNFVFPTTRSPQRDGVDYFSVTRHNSMLQHPPQPRSPSVRSQTLQPSVSAHSKVHDSISSTASDQTVVADAPRKAKRTDSALSTETLCEEGSGYFARRASQSSQPSAPPPAAPAAPPPLLQLNSLPGPTQPPRLTKQNTVPTLTLSHELSFDRIQQTQLSSLNKMGPALAKRDLTASLPSDVSGIAGDELAALLAQAAPQNLLIIDIRPFNDYAKAHVRGAVNMCLPSTLFKRANFSLRKCINSLSDYERSVVSAFCSQEDVVDPSAAPMVILYDSQSSGGRSGNTQNLANMCLKFSQDMKHYRVYALRGGFQAFSAAHAACTESDVGFEAAAAAVPPGQQRPAPPPLTARTMSLSQLPFEKTPVLSRFVLPEAKAMFKIRHNEEQLTAKTADFGLLVDYCQLSPQEQQQLPALIKKSAAQICDEFAQLEMLEKRRLSGALNSCARGSSGLDALSLELSSPPPTISSGIEFGYKNRYKDIFLYEHSRVKLRDVDAQQQCDYINASYLASSSGSQRYIATQGPLKDTVGDFWKIVVNDKVPLILSLTQETENGVSKCFPFWKSGSYASNNNVLTVTEVDAQSVELNVGNASLPESTKSILLRAFEVQVDQQPTRHRVIQAHVLSWPDMELIVNPKDLLSLVFMKNYLMGALGSSAPILVHCSAGCGRTGSFCAVDSIISELERAPAGSQVGADVIFSTVNALRKQRVSMVQTLRQYFLIYDLVMMYSRHQVYARAGKAVPASSEWDNFDNLRIIQDFVHGPRTT